MQPNGKCQLSPCLAALLALSAWLFAGCTPEHASAPVDRPEPELPLVSADLVRVELSSLPTVLRAQGNLAADEVAEIGSIVPGRVSEVHVDLGDHVELGSPLATVMQADYELQVELAEAQLLQTRAALGMKPEDPIESLNPENSPPVREARSVWDEAKSRVKRMRQLYERNAITQDEVDLAIAAEGVADARYSAALNSVGERVALIGVRSTELAVARQRLADTLIRAPFPGRVRERFVSPGAYLQIGDPVIHLVREQTLRFRGAMPERHAYRLAVGQAVTLKIESLPEPRSGQITRISPALEELSRALLFEVEIDNSDGSLRSGLFAEAEVVVDPGALSLVVPRESVTEFAGARRVWKVVDGVAREQLIAAGRTTPKGIEVLEGLSEGDLVLREGEAGAPARIEPRTLISAVEILHGAATGDIPRGEAE